MKKVMSKSLSYTVGQQLRTIGRGRRLTVGVILRNDFDVTMAAMTSGYRVIVMSDRFRALHSLGKRYGKMSPDRPNPMLIEVNLRHLPLAPHCLDVLVLDRGLPSMDTPKNVLSKMRKLLAPGGTLIWPHPVVEGFGGKLGRILVPHRRKIHSPMERHRLCSLMMEAGYGQVGQSVPKGGLIPWIVTTGCAGRI